jgi:hypothetical protein
LPTRKHDVVSVVWLVSRAERDKPNQLFQVRLSFFPYDSPAPPPLQVVIALFVVCGCFDPLRCSPKPTRNDWPRSYSPSVCQLRSFRRKIASPLYQRPESFRWPLPCHTPVGSIGRGGTPLVAQAQDDADRLITATWLLSVLQHPLTTTTHRRSIHWRRSSDGGAAISARFSPSSRHVYAELFPITHHRQDADPLE